MTDSENLAQTFHLTVADFIAYATPYLDNKPAEKKIFFKTIKQVGYKDFTEYVDRFIFQHDYEKLIPLTIEYIKTNNFKGKDLLYISKNQKFLTEVLGVCVKTNPNEEEIFEKYKSLPEKQRSICAPMEWLVIKLHTSFLLSLLDAIPFLKAISKKQILENYKQVNLLYEQPFIPTGLIDYVKEIPVMGWNNFENKTEEEILSMVFDKDKILWNGTIPELKSFINEQVKKGVLIDNHGRDIDELAPYFFNVINEINPFQRSQPLQFSIDEKQILLFFKDLIFRKKICYPDVTDILLQKIVLHFTNKKNESLEFRKLQQARSKYRHLLI